MRLLHAGPDLLCHRHGRRDYRGLPSAVSGDIVDRAFTLDHDEVRERISGNLCRCGAHNGIIAAVIGTFAAETSA